MSTSANFLSISLTFIFSQTWNCFSSVNISPIGTQAPPGADPDQLSSILKDKWIPDEQKNQVCIHDATGHEMQRVNQVRFYTQIMQILPKSNIMHLMGLQKYAGSVFGNAPEAVTNQFELRSKSKSLCSTECRPLILYSIN